MLRSFLLVLPVIFGLTTSRAQAIPYDIEFMVPGGSVTGTVETNGTLGVLSTSDIIDWIIDVVNGLDSFTLIGDGQPGDNSEVFIVGASVSASESHLQFDFNGSGFLLFQAPVIGSGETWFCLQNSGCTGTIEDTFIANPTASPAGTLLGPTYSGTLSFGQSDAAPVPLPASGALLLAGLAVLIRRSSGAARPARIGA